MSSLRIGSDLVKDVRVGADAATAVFLGTEQVWPSQDGYRSYRFQPVELRGAAANSVQVGGFELLVGTSPVRGGAAFGVAIDSPPAEGPGGILDGTDGGKWLNFSKTHGYVYVTFPTRFVPSGFRLTTANDHAERDPVRFNVYGSNDATHWDLLYRGEMTTDPGRLTARDYPLPAAAPTKRLTYLQSFLEGVPNHFWAQSVNPHASVTSDGPYSLVSYGNGGWCPIKKTGSTYAFDMMDFGSCDLEIDFLKLNDDRSIFNLGLFYKNPANGFDPLVGLSSHGIMYRIDQAGQAYNYNLFKVTAGEHSNPLPPSRTTGGDVPVGKWLRITVNNPTYTPQLTITITDRDTGTLVRRDEWDSIASLAQSGDGTVWVGYLAQKPDGATGMGFFVDRIVRPAGAVPDLPAIEDILFVDSKRWNASNSRVGCVVNSSTTLEFKCWSGTTLEPAHDANLMRGGGSFQVGGVLNIDHANWAIAFAHSEIVGTDLAVLNMTGVFDGQQVKVTTGPAGVALRYESLLAGGGVLDVSGDTYAAGWTLIQRSMGTVSIWHNGVVVASSSGWTSTDPVWDYALYLSIGALMGANGAVTADGRWTAAFGDIFLMYRPPLLADAVRRLDEWFKSRY
jgi:hypothetical protein